jgi:hypothetical protein
VKFPTAPFLYFLHGRHVSQIDRRRYVPDGGGDSGNSVFLGNLGLVDRDLGEFTWLLVELDRLGTGCQYNYGTMREGDIHDGINLDITTEVSGQITEVGTLLNDGSHIDGLVPPCWLGNSLVSGGLISASPIVG